MSNLRFKVVEEAFKKRPLEVKAPTERPSEYLVSTFSIKRRCLSIFH